MIYPEILVGGYACAELVARDDLHDLGERAHRVTVDQYMGARQPVPTNPLALIAEQGMNAWTVLLVPLRHGVNVCPHDQYGFHLESPTLVEWPPFETVFTDPSGWLRALAERLVPVLAAKLELIEGDRKAELEARSG